MIKKIGSILQSRNATKEEVEKAYESVEENIVHCKDCKHLMFSDMYGECSKKLRIVHPSDYCDKGEKRNCKR